ncbi:MAG: peptidoglycan DD-metalloendopeptidase family protein [Bacteroidota bacterium]
MVVFLCSACTSGSQSHADTISQADTIKESRKLFGIKVDSLEIVSASIQNNENLGEILGRYNVSAQKIAQLASLPKDLFNVRALKANKPYTILHQKDSLKSAKSFIYQPNAIDYVILHLDDSVSVEAGQNPVDTIRNTISGIIETSLYNSMMDAGASPQLVNELADVYAWEVDFFGLQTGDSYKIIYDSYEVNGEFAGLGSIQAGIFNHMGEDHYAFMYDQGEGREYFDEKGNSLRKTFLKTPLKFTRISSRFSYSRLHPVLKIRRPHLGVDYAAPRGTPVRAVGSGKVTKANYSGGAGHMVKIKHNSNYVSGYLHLSGYGKGIKVGTTVEQGQIIGYVGSTGLSTGPHLDFRFWKNGRAVNPLSIDPPSASPIKEELLPMFGEHTAYWTEQLSFIKLPELEKDMLATTEENAEENPIHD